ncbi:cytochrome oxidase putative small subunit CydP [Noviherbaspirillum sp.]|uniref:cytochrome oxidase putative small subunit CydP n=1 Tax=Noviherbaspirillum sp. TaxID=1926288 RepID=UPI0025EC7F84|nr:cytochrome oxidase putative small subunit CydP [Noviherbaspirillum sp.]
MTDRRLLLELSIVLILKMLLLFALWWVFVRDERVNVDAEHAARAIVGATITTVTTPATPEQQGAQHGR